METGGNTAAQAPSESVETAAPQTAERAAPVSKDMTDAELLAQLFQTPEAPAQDEDPEAAQEKNKLAESRERLRAQNIERLESHYGDQQFAYGSHQGGIGAMIAMCPPIQDLLGEPDGADRIIRWIDQYKVVEEEAEETEEAANEDESNENEEKAEAKSRQEKERLEREKARKERETEKKQVDADKKQAPNEAPAQAAPEKNTKEDRETKQAEQRAPAENHTPSTQQAEHSHHLKTPEKATVKDMEKAPPPTRIEAVLEQEIVTQALEPIEPVSHKEEFVAAEIMETAEPEIRQPHSSEESELPSAPEIDTAEAVSDEAEHKEESNHSLDTAPEKESPLIILPKSEVLASWRELGEQEAPLELTLTTIIEQLQVYEHRVAPQDADVDNELLENIAEPEKPSDLPELYTVLQRVTSARQAVEHLFTATTKEECEEQVAVVIQEVTQLLTLLGYENPRVIIQEFLAKYPLQSLHDLLEYLETSLRQSVERQQARQRTGAKPKHTSLLASLAMRIMQVMAPHYEAA